MTSNRFEIISEILKDAANMVKPGITGVHVDAFIEKTMADYNVKPFNKGYQPKTAKTPYPAVSCINTNDIIAHGFPTDIPFKEGDIVSIDTAIVQDGLCADAAITVAIGKVPARVKHLLKYAKGALYETIKAVKAGISTYELAEVCELYCLRHNFVVNYNFVGHTIGKEMHERPQVPHSTHYLKPEAPRDLLVEGQIICLEPMLTYKDPSGAMLPNGWTAVTQDGSPSAFFEHMVEVTKDGAKILTTHFSE